MSNENLSYSTDEMTATAQSLRTFLDQQWQEHTRLFMTQPTSYHNLLNGLSAAFAKAAPQGQTIGDAVSKYHQQYQEVYQALSTLADHIDLASQAVSASEESFGKLFLDQQK